jgi:hypothetical protein
VLLNLTLVALDAPDPDAAAQTCREVLELCRDIGDRCGATARCLEVAASVAAARGGGARSARLLGAAAALREAVGAPLPAAERLEHDAWVSAAVALLGGAQYGALWREGRSLSVEQAVQLACVDGSQPEPRQLP